MRRGQYAHRAEDCMKQVPWICDMRSAVDLGSAVSRIVAMAKWQHRSAEIVVSRCRSSDELRSASAMPGRHDVCARWRDDVDEVARTVIQVFDRGWGRASRP
jgi:hypothetical protein